MGAIRAFVAAVIFLAAMGAQAEPAPTEPLRQLLQHAPANASVRVLVGVQLAEPYRPEAELDLAQGAAQRGRISAAQDQVVDLIAGLGGRTRTRYRFVPYVAAEVPAAAVSELLGSPWVASVSADRLRHPTLLRSTALIGADQAWRAGLTGAGWTVALPDTGIDANHPFLAGQVVAEACDSSTWIGNAVQPATVSLCPGGAESSTQAGSGTNCDAALADCDHGTLAAGIVAGRNGPDGLSGIAPEATLIALQIYSRKADGSGIGAWDSDLIKALERVYALREEQPIAAVNLSLAGTDIYADQSACDAEHPALVDAIELLRSVGIATVAAAGNDGSRTALAAPACLSNVISVGASCTAGPDAGFCANGPDSIATYSNVSSFLSLLAPGSYITSSIPGDGYETLSGTSMAAPHVAGAFALLRQQSPDADPDELLQRLREAAASIDDTRIGGTAKALMMLDVRELAPASASASANAAPTAELLARESADAGSSSEQAAGVEARQQSAASSGPSSTDVLAPMSPSSAASTAVSAGGLHTCAVASGGGAKCWGQNSSGQLGDGSTTNRLTPVSVAGLTSELVAISAGGFGDGGYHSCAVTSGGGAKCWGGNGFGQLGNGSTSGSLTPVDVSGLSSGMRSIAAGYVHTCALSASGAVKCWGYNYYGSLGDGTSTNRSAPVDVTGLTGGVAAIATGGLHTCALTSGGGVKCWGMNSNGQLGDNSNTNRLVPVDVVGLGSGVVAIAAGEAHTCAVVSGGGVKCWGSNSHGQVGNDVTDRWTPMDVPGLASGIADVTAGGAHTCVLTTGGGAKCWGFNSSGQLGDNSSLERWAPVNVVGLSSGVVAIDAGGSHTCALLDSGLVKCWGENGFGQVGDNTNVDRWIPVTVTGITGPDWMPDAFAFASQTGVATSVILTSNTITPTGFNTTTAILVNNGTYSVGCTGSFTSAAGEISPGQSVCVRHVSSASPSTATTTTLTIGGVSGTFISETALEPDTTPDAFGFDPLAGVALGATMTSNSVTPGGYDSTAPISVLDGLYSIGCTGFFTVTASMISPGQSVCVRHIASATPGTTVTTTLTIGGVAGTFSSTTTTTSGVAAAVSAGDLHTCTLTTDGGVMCWGDNAYGQLGDNSTADRATAVEVIGLASGVSAVAAGGDHSCALISGGGVKCWGDNYAGQLGDGSTTSRLAPVNVTGLSSGVTAVVTGGSHSCALTSVGGVKCWGSNFGGQVGDSSTVSRSTPVDVTGLASGVAAISAGTHHTCALTSGGAVKCWGWNYWGQLGDNSTTNRSAPVTVSGLASGVTELEAGGYYTCARTGNSMKCWGRNAYGQLGDGSTTDRLTPVDVTGLPSGVTAVSGGSSHTCVLTAGGGVQCWGHNAFGQLGDNSTTGRLTPVDVSGLPTGVAAIAAGGYHTCALTDIGSLKCWGNNYDGQVGDGSNTNRLAPVSVTGFPGLPDTTPDAFGFTAQTGVTTGATVTSNTIMPSGYNTAAPISVSNGEYSIGCTGSFTGSASTISPGQSVCVRHTASASPSTTVTTTLTIGGVNGTFSSTTAAPVFYTLTVNKAGSGSGSVSSAPAGISCGGDCTESYTAGTVVTLTATPDGGSTFAGWSGGGCGGTGTCQVTMNAANTVTATFNLIPDTTPDAFGFTAQTGVTTGATVTSNTIMPSGYNTAAPISVSNGEYSIGCTGSFTGSASTISPGQSVCVRHTASASPSTTVTTTLTIGGVNGTFSSTTEHALPGIVSVSPATVDFGGQSMLTSSMARTVTISNAGGLPLTISSLSAATPFSVAAHNCGTLPAALAAGSSCSAELTFTPPVEAAFNGSMTVATDAGNAVVPLSGLGERSLVVHYYSAILGRNPDAGGKDWWQDQVDRVELLGADINEVWYAMAMGFFNSTEYLSFGKTDSEFVDDLYRTFLNREPETDGRNWWLDQIAQGLTREVVLVAFMFSDEFRQFTASIFGDTTVRPELNMVMDFYRGLLSRLPDDAGFGFWVQQFRQAQCTGAAAVTAQAESISSQFATGPEYANRNRTNSQYLGDLYNAILRRGGDAAGVNFWKGLLDSNALTREQVRQQFVQGPEFQGRVAQIIAAGCLP